MDQPSQNPQSQPNRPQRPKIKSPCTGKCRYRGGKCATCFRTMEEIRNWRKYTDEERDEIILRLSKQKDDPINE